MPTTRKTVDDGVRVRMYRQGLGDCFLISFPKQGGGRFHLVIDCGVILGTHDADTLMPKVARSIAGETGGKLDLLVATHEHWDHLSGFVQAAEVWEKEIEVGEVWLAWTEDPGHPLARELQKDRRRKVAHLRAAAQRMAGDAAFGAAAQALEGVLGFFGGLGAAGGGGGSTRDAMEGLAKRSDARVVYRRPGEPPVALKGVDGVRVFVLGPPEDRTLIRKSDPTRRGAEVYELAGSMSLADTFFAGLGVSGERVRELGGAALDPELAELAFPFDRKHRIAARAAGESRHADFFRGFYGRTDDGRDPERDSEGPGGWRRVDGDWLGVANDLALALDSDTNNTSLALAFELGEGGPVLLFPADAQVGNWESWQQLSWPADPRKPDGAKITADDLLGRTVLYKVGHHGSHNATLRANGLEKMTSPDLVALIPVNEEMAKKKRWKMPFASLYERLKGKTRGRVLRVDQGRLPLDEAAKYGLTRAEWKEFERRTPEDTGPDALWIDYHLDHRPRPRRRPTATGRPSARQPR
ncbi:MAG TPA: MBL fold metallo-hydrolase [Longimicrobium sp.]|nr:MBL fold metallo-hydrolase [Longimicrobium sp.]